MPPIPVENPRRIAIGAPHESGPLDAPRMTADVRGALTAGDLRAALVADAPAALARILPEIRAGRIRPEQVNVHALLEASDKGAVGASVRLADGADARDALVDPASLLLGEVARTAFLDGYNEAGFDCIGQELVTPIGNAEVISDDRTGEKRVSFVPLRVLETTARREREGEPFPPAKFDEETIGIPHAVADGRTLSIGAEELEEAGQKANAAPLAAKARALGRYVRHHEERQILDRVTDRYGSKTSDAGPHYVYRPGGVPTPLYNATDGAPGSRAPLGTRLTNNALTDANSMNAAFAQLDGMLDSEGRRLVADPFRRLALVPASQASLAAQLLEQLYAYQPADRRPRLLSSTYLDEISTGAWYAGNFAAQFVQHRSLELEIVSMFSEQSIAFLNRRELFSLRAAWAFEVAAIDYNRVVQSVPSTTY
ncbi:MAG: hypothetical protein AMXMBFR7_25530 [Planctomycetota bacterium]